MLRSHYRYLFGSVFTGEESKISNLLSALVWALVKQLPLNVINSIKECVIDRNYKAG